ncbi:MAG: NAD(P)-binding domain-containing protein [Alphaproteobacteria bacterium]
MSTTVGIIGVGHFAQYLVEGFRRDGSASVRIVLSPRREVTARALAARYPNVEVARDNQAVVDAADVVLLAVRTKDAVPTARALKWRKGQRLVSFVAGTTLEALGVAVPSTVARAMASAAIARHESTIVLYPEDGPARAVLEPLGPVLAMRDEAMLAAASIMYAYYAMLFAIMAEGERWIMGHGAPAEAARTIVGWAFRGAGNMLLAEPGRALPEIVASLATPGGITERGLQSLEAEDALSAWQRALEAALRRTRGEE